MSVRLFIGNLPYSATEAELREHLSAVGVPASVVLPVDRETGRPRGFAFVDYADRGVAEEAIQRFDQQPFKGRPLAVSRGPSARRARPRRAEARRIWRPPTAGRVRWTAARWTDGRSPTTGRLQRPASGRFRSCARLAAAQLRARRTAQAQAQAAQGAHASAARKARSKSDRSDGSTTPTKTGAPTEPEDPEIDNVATHKDADEADDE